MAPALGESLGDAPPQAPARPSWLTKGTRGRLALWLGLALLWFLFLPQYIAARRAGPIE